MSKLFGNKKFYKDILLIALPIILYQVLTNMLGLVDNIMIGRLGDEAISGIGITNQLLFVFNLSFFGLLASSGVMISQFSGAKNTDGIRLSFHFKLISGFLMLLLSLLIFVFGGETLIKTFIHEESEEATLVFQNAKTYLEIMLFSLPAFALSTVLGTTLREDRHPIFPLISTSSSIVVNISLNALLIFGWKEIGISPMGIKGAAYASVIARYVEMMISVLIVLLKHKALPYFSLKKSNKELKGTIKKIIVLGIPLFANEICWSLGMSVLANIYASRGLDALGAYNISQTISNITVLFATSSAMALSIYIGNLLGASKIEEAKEDVVKFITFNFLLCGGIMILAILGAFLFPKIYDVSFNVKSLATRFLLVNALILPIQAINCSCYFTLRAGGVSIITFLFDSFYTWVFCIPLALILVRLTNLNVVFCLLFVNCLELLKSICGITLIRKGIWIRVLS